MKQAKGCQSGTSENPNPQVSKIYLYLDSEINLNYLEHTGGTKLNKH